VQQERGRIRRRGLFVCCSAYNAFCTDFLFFLYLLYICCISVMNRRMESSGQRVWDDGCKGNGSLVSRAFFYFNNKFSHLPLVRNRETEQRELVPRH
jgi:hypothetical protein